METYSHIPEKVAFEIVDGGASNAAGDSFVSLRLFWAWFFALTIRGLFFKELISWIFGLSFLVITLSIFGFIRYKFNLPKGLFTDISKFLDKVENASFSLIFILPLIFPVAVLELLFNFDSLAFLVQTLNNTLGYNISVPGTCGGIISCLFINGQNYLVFIQENVPYVLLGIFSKWAD